MMSTTFGRRSIPLILHVCVTACLSLLPAQAIESQQSHGNEATQYFIERIEVAGNRRVQNATIRAHILSRTGDTYNAEAVQRDAQALRDTGYFTEVRLRVENSPDQPNGKIVVFDLREKPIIRRIEYRGIKSITEADIHNAYKDSKIILSVESKFDPTKLTRAATVIEELLSAHGHPSATVKSTYETIASANAVTIVFQIDEGPSAQRSKNP